MPSSLTITSYIKKTPTVQDKKRTDKANESGDKDTAMNDIASKKNKIASDIFSVALSLIVNKAFLRCCNAFQQKNRINTVPKIAMPANINTQSPI